MVDPLVDQVNNYPPPTPEGEIVIQGRGARVGENGLNHEVLTFRKALEMFAGLLSKKNVRLICRGTDCYTDGSLIVIPDLSILDRKGMTPDEQRRAAEFLEAVRGFVSHEVGHVVYTDFSTVKKRAFTSKSKMHHMVWNCVEDAFIEKKMKELWAGVAVDLTNKSEWALRKLVDPSKWSHIPPIGKILTGFLDIADRGGKYQKSWYYKGLHPLYQKVLDDLKPEIMACVKAQSTGQCTDIAERIVEKLKLVNSAQSPMQQLIQEEANKLKQQANEQEEDNEDAAEQYEVGSVPGDADDDSEGDDGEDNDPSEAGGRGGDDEESSDDDGDDDGDDGELDDGDLGEDADGDDDGDEEGGAEGDGDGSDGDGEEDDEEEGEEGSGDAEGESDDGEDGDDGEGGGTGDGDDESDGLDDEDEYSAELDEKSEVGGGSGNKGVPEQSANPVRPNDLWGFDDLEDPSKSGSGFTVEDLIKDEASTQLNKSAGNGSGYRVFSDEWDKVGHIDNLMPLIAPGYVIDEVREKTLYERLYKKADAHIGVMKRKLQSILTTQSKPRHMRNLEDGDLDFTNLYKFALQNTDDSSKVFKRTTYTFNNNEVCVALCVNESGSMAAGNTLRCDIIDPSGAKDHWGNPKRVPTDPKCVSHSYCVGHGSLTRMDLAREVALIFGETLGALNVPFRVVGHTAEPTAACNSWGTPKGNMKSVANINRTELHHYTRLGALVLAEYKGWEERWTAIRHKLVRMQPRTNTYDGEVLRRVAEEIATRREKRKVIFMLDDGIPEPSDFNVHKHREYLKDIVKSVTASGIEIICLSMQERAAKEYYPNCIVINEVAETPLIAATELKRILMSAMKRSGT